MGGYPKQLVLRSKFAGSSATLANTLARLRCAGCEVPFGSRLAAEPTRTFAQLAAELRDVHGRKVCRGIDGHRNLPLDFLHRARVEVVPLSGVAAKSTLPLAKHAHDRRPLRRHHHQRPRGR